ncbi:ATP-binding protein [Rhizobium sp. LCM 4573]|uniref:ATP-binding protein n=1 Tax=Rhizobium sp. LCM 4573 TaxID=1848291 RepID=UPI0008D8D707|nr:ATP-binding protein [Rhizobium sp. LCM 4573]OHV81647.1 hypothetical protein LCM4573_21435 [Rhizobium sp. LCM 4573]
MISLRSAAEIVKTLNEIDETSEIEAKEISGNTVGKSIYETICAFSNEPDLGGGTILLGVKKEVSLFSFYAASGVKDPDKIALEIATNCNTLFNVPLRVEIKTEAVDGLNVVRVNVPEVPGHQKPIYIKGQMLPRGAFRRIGSADVRCTEEDLLVFYHGKQNKAFDTHVIDDASMDDIDPAAISAYRKARAESNAEAEELNWTDEELLHAVGALRRLDGKLRVTAAGVLIFGKTHAIRRLFPVHRIDYIRVPGRVWISDPENRFESIDMRGPMILIISRIIAAITDDLPKTFRLEDNRSGQRTDLPILPVRVLREAVVNALMHRNYQIHQPIQIIRYSNRLVIKNPGYSLKAEEKFDDPGSISRNPHIAAILHDTRFAENKGSGIRVMREQLEGTGLSAPSLDSDRVNDTFTAIFLFHHFLNRSDWEWLKQFSDLDLSEDQKRALIFVREVGAIDNQTFRSFSRVDTLSASRSLKKMRDLELLVLKGSSSKTYYEAGPRLIEAQEDPELTLGVNSQDKAPNSQDNSEISIKDVPAKLRVQIQAIALGRRAPPEKMFALIEALCSWRPLSASELAKLLERSNIYVAQSYLYPMIKDERLSFLYPEMKNHPNQKYVANKRPSQQAR